MKKNHFKIGQNKNGKTVELKIDRIVVLNSI